MGLSVDQHAGSKKKGRSSAGVKEFNFDKDVFGCCIAEMGMSMSDFFLCTFQELMILIEVYREKEKKQWYHTRMIAYCNMVSNWQNTKRRPPSINRYMNLDPNELSSDEYVEERLSRLEQLQKEYAQKVKSKKDIN